MRRDEGATSDEEAMRHRQTYRFLRMAMPALGVVLFASVLHQVIATSPDCWLTSISAYYYTPARAVFVGALFGIGTCLVVYRGQTSREDVALNLAGVLAMFVALIPTPLKAVKPDEDLEACSRSNVPTNPQLEAALDNNVTAALIGLAVMALAYVVFRWCLPSTPGVGRPAQRTVVFTCLLTAIVWVAFLAARDTFYLKGHLVAAVGLFIGIGLMIVMHVWPALAVPRGKPAPPDSPGMYRVIYGVCFVTMLACAAVFGTLAFMDRANGLFWLETSVIVTFVVFWVAQTVEHWKPQSTDG